MSDSLFSGSTVPALEQVVSFTQKRHAVLASNIANISTPGYRARDMSPELFESRLKEALEKKPVVDPYDAKYGPSGEAKADFAEVREATETVLFHDGSDVGLEHQIAEIGKNQTKHNTAIAIMAKQFQLLKAAISERP